MKTRFYAHGLKIFDSHFNVEICSASFERDSNPIKNAQAIEAAKRYAKVIASALNHHNEREGGL